MFDENRPYYELGSVPEYLDHAPGELVRKRSVLLDISATNVTLPSYYYRHLTRQPKLEEDARQLFGRWKEAGVQRPFIFSAKDFLLSAAEFPHRIEVSADLIPGWAIDVYGSSLQALLRYTLTGATDFTYSFIPPDCDFWQSELQSYRGRSKIYEFGYVLDTPDRPIFIQFLCPYDDEPYSWFERMTAATPLIGRRKIINIISTAVAERSEDSIVSERLQNQLSSPFHVDNWWSGFLSHTQRPTYPHYNREQRALSYWYDKVFPGLRDYITSLSEQVTGIFPYYVSKHIDHKSPQLRIHPENVQDKYRQ